MAIAWYLCPYKRRADPLAVARYVAMHDFTPLILADGGAWAETEVLDTASPANGGTAGWAVVKVRASSTTLSTISGQPDFLFLLGDTPLDTAMSALTNQQRNVINTKLRTQGYSQAEIDAALGSTLAEWRAHTYRDLLNFAATRRLTPRYDAANDAIIIDGAERPVTPIGWVDGKVR